MHDICHHVTNLLVVIISCCTGGLGEAVCGALSEETGVKVRRLAVTGIPRSGPGSVLLDLYGVSSKQVVAAVKDLLK
jgi:transketolase